MLVPTWVDRPTDPKDGTLLTIRLKNQNKIRTALSDQLKNFNFYSLLFRECCEDQDRPPSSRELHYY